MTVESIDKLREYGHDCCARIDDAIHDHADEIEAEISERYMPLPLDADGVPIRIGDMLENKFSDYGCLAVHGYTETCALCHKVPPADLETYYVEFTNAHHVKPRTINGAARSNNGVTAEQVREAIEHHFGRVAVLDDGKPVEWRYDWVCKVAIDYRAIADELNATLGAGTCHMEHEYTGTVKAYEYMCDVCGEFAYTFLDEEPPNYCPNCGRKVER